MHSAAMESTQTGAWPPFHVKAFAKWPRRAVYHANMKACATMHKEARLASCNNAVSLPPRIRAWKQTVWEALVDGTSRLTSEPQAVRNKKQKLGVANVSRCLLWSRTRNERNGPLNCAGLEHYWPQRRLAGKRARTWPQPADRADA